MVPRRLAPMMIGAVCGPSSVTVFAIATRLLSLVSTPVMSTMGVRGPQATELFAKNDERGLRELVLYSCRATSVLTSGLVIALVIFSPSVCDLWLGRTFPELTPTLAILGFGLWFSLNQIVTRLTLVAAAEHRWLTYLGLTQAGLFLAIGSVAMTLQVPLFDELMGWALLLSALEAITQGVAVAIVSKRAIGTSGIALLGATVSPLWRVMPAALLGLAIQRFWPIESGLELLFAGSICGVVWLACCRSLLFPNFRPFEFMASHFERRALRLAR